MKEPSITVKLSAELYDKVRRYAFSHDISKAEAVRKMLTNFNDTMENSKTVLQENIVTLNPAVGKQTEPF